MTKKELLNSITTISPIIAFPFIGLGAVIFRNKYYAFFAACYCWFSWILTGFIILFRKEVFIKRWLLGWHKLFNGLLLIGFGIGGIIYYWNDLYAFVVNNFLNK